MSRRARQDPSYSPCALPTRRQTGDHLHSGAYPCGICRPSRSAGADAHLGRPLKNHEWAVIGDAGHAVAWEQPETFNRTVLEFLSRH
jgi:pimeloyl-ACP methyl ester carboxylesterase